MQELKRPSVRVFRKRKRYYVEINGETYWVEGVQDKNEAVFIAIMDYCEDYYPYSKSSCIKKMRKKLGV